MEATPKNKGLLLPYLYFDPVKFSPNLLKEESLIAKSVPDADANKGIKTFL